MPRSQIDRILEGRVLASAPQKPVEPLAYIRPDAQTRRLMREDAGRALRAYAIEKYEQEIEQEQANGRERNVNETSHRIRRVYTTVAADSLGCPELNGILRELHRVYAAGEMARAHMRATDI
jgi:hypothetical protein